MKELRRANLEKLVEKLREQIREYWDKCYYRYHGVGGHETMG